MTRDKQGKDLLQARCAQRGGFTFLELLVVLAVLAVITAAVVPMYSQSMIFLQIRNQRNNLVSLMSFVQERAVVDSREYRIYFDEDEGAYWVMHCVGVDEEGKLFENVATEYGRRRLLPEYLSFDKVKARKDRDRGAQYMGCYPNGASDRITIRVGDTRNTRRRFEIETLGAMGQVEIKESTVR